MSSNSSCASETDLARFASLNLLISQLADLTASIVTFIATYLAVKLIFQKSIFQMSTKILLLQTLLYANLHQVSYGIEASITIYKSLFKLSTPCELMYSEQECAPYLNVLLIGISGMIYGQTGLMLERGFATFASSYGREKRLLIGLSIALIILIGSMFTGKILLWDDPLDGYVFSCVAIPRTSTPRSNVYFSVLCGLTLFNLGVSFLIRRYNKVYEYQTRFKVADRFRKREVIDSTGTICFLTFAQFIAMFIYTFGLLILRNIRTMILPATFHFFVVWLYTVPFFAVLFPLLLIHRIRSTRVNRVHIISRITQTKQSQEDHFKEIKGMWS